MGRVQRVLSVGLVGIVLSGGISGCYIARATGETVEAVGTGVGRALGGVSSGVGHIVAGTGRAVTRAADGSRGSSRAARADADLVSDRYDDEEMRF